MKISVKHFFIGVFCVPLAGYATYLVFHSPFIKVTIDYLSFTAGFFLVIDAACAISRSKAPFFPFQIPRIIRIGFGLCIFLIHVDQFLCHRAFSSQIAEIKIDCTDYAALSAAIFLVMEGLTKLSRSKSPIFPGQLARLFRIAIGSIILTIHILQFSLC